MTRGGRKTDRDDPIRRCIATGDEQSKERLIRFVVGPEGQIVPDIAGKLPGRGIWVSADRAALDKAVSKRLFARAAKQTVTVPEGLVDAVEVGLARRVVDLVSLARKAGAAVAGYEKVKAWIDEGRARVLIQASDGSERGKTKINLPPDAGPTIGCLTGGELGLSFGRGHAIHAALGGGGLTTRIVEDAGRLSGLRASSRGTGPGKDEELA